MIMRLLAGLWVCVVALGASYGATMWKMQQSIAATAPAEKVAVELHKLKFINVPMIAKGVVQGYVVAQLSYTADAAALKKADIAPDPFILDEAFRLIYGDETLDFKNLKKFDLTAFSTNLKKSVRERMKSDVLQDILVQELSFIPADDVRR